MTEKISVEIKLTTDDLNAAMRSYLEARGFIAASNFKVHVRTIPGDRPFDAEYTTVEVTGVFVAAPSASARGAA